MLTTYCLLAFRWKSWPHPQTAPLMWTVMLHCWHTFLSFLSILGNKENRDQKWQRRDTQACPAVGSYATAWRMRMLLTWHVHASAACRRWRVRDQSHIGFFACSHAIAISGTQSFQENRHININVLVAQKPLVPLIGRLVACSVRTRTDRRTDRQTDRQTDQVL